MLSHGATTAAVQFATNYNVGACLKPTDNFNVLFSVGHTFNGERHAIGYLGLYWTWGPPEEEPKPTPTP